MTQPITLSLFGDRSGVQIDRVAVDWDTLCAQFAAPPVYADKSQAQLFSLCEFGEARTDKGSLRSNDNVRQIWGVCGDYDGERVTPEQARDALQAASITALVYTSPSHTPEAPRWRIVAPFAAPAAPDTHAAAVERLNSIVGGGLSSESFTLSQPFYIGRVAGREATYRAYRVDGVSIDRADHVPRQPWRGAQRADGGYRVDAEALLDDLRAGIEIHPAIVALAARGYTQEELEDVVRRHMSSWERPERGDVAIREDIPRAVNSWARKQQRDLERKLAAVGVPPPYQITPSAPATPRMLRRLSDITSAPRKLTWLIRDRIEQPSFAVMFGPPEQGKTFVAIDIGCSVALGRPWRGQKVTKVPVHYLTGEGHNGFGRRLLAWKIANGISDAEWNAADMFVSPQAFNMNDQTALDAYYDETKQFGTPGLLIIDTLTRFTPGVDQSSQKEMGVFVRNVDLMVKAWNCTVIILHHTGQTDQTRAMGSIVLKGAVDVEMSVHLKGGIVRLGNTKNKEGERFPEQRFKFRSITLPWLEDPDTEPGAAPVPQKSAVLDVTEDGDAPDPDKPVKPNKVITLMREALAGGPLAETPFRQGVVRIFNGTPDAARKAFARQLPRALEAGVIIYDDDTHTYHLAHTGQDKT